MDLLSVFERLAVVRRLRFRAESQTAARTGWAGDGCGDVAVERPEPGVLLFRESGTWTSAAGRSFPFTNVFRWTLVPPGQSIRLEHLRHDPDRPVYLFDLSGDAGRLAAVTPHACRDDCYDARMEVTVEGIRFDWVVRGPRKDERIGYVYT